MKKCPIPVAIVSVVLILTGVFGTISHLGDFRAWVSVLAIVAGAFMLRACNWARWLAMAWIGFHVAISILNSWSQLAVHILVFAAFAWFLFRPAASRYFRGGEL